MQLLKPHLGVFLLIVRGLQEQGRNLLVAVLLGFGCKVGVLVSGLGLPCESSFQVLFGLSACVFVCHNVFLLKINFELIGFTQSLDKLEFFGVRKTFRCCRRGRVSRPSSTKLPIFSHFRRIRDIFEAGRETRPLHSLSKKRADKRQFVCFLT